MITTPIIHPRGKLNIYQDLNNEWRWAIISVNGKIIAASSEGFFSKNYCEENARITYLALADFLRMKETVLPKKILPKPTLFRIISNHKK